MIYTLRELFDWSVQTDSAEGWVPSRPLPGPFVWRVKAALAVLTGRADAFLWPAGQ